MYWNTAETKQVEFTVNGHTLTAVVTISYGDDCSPLDGSVDFGNSEEEQEYYARFESGELVNAVVRVSAVWDGVQEDDYLGGCHTTASNVEEEVKQLAVDHGMIETALSLLTTTITKNVEKYAKLQNAKVD